MGFVALSGRLGGVSFGRQRGTGACAAAGGGAGDGGEGLSSKEPNTKREPIEKSQDTVVVVPAGARVLTVVLFKSKLQRVSGHTLVRVSVGWSCRPLRLSWRSRWIPGLMPAQTRQSAAQPPSPTVVSTAPTQGQLIKSLTLSHVQLYGLECTNKMKYFCSHANNSVFCSLNSIARLSVGLCANTTLLGDTSCRSQVCSLNLTISNLKHFVSTQLTKNLYLFCLVSPVT